MLQINQSIKKVLLVTVCFSLVYAAAILEGGAQSKDGIRFDAEWWKHRNSDEQQGYIYGHLDCRQTLNAAKASIVDYQNAVTRVIKSEKKNDPHAVNKAIERALKTLPPRDNRGAEHYGGPHGFLDGEWWEQSEKAAGQGYVEGYLDCSSPPATVEAVRRYQTAIDHYYASDHHNHDKIASVLRPLLKLPVNP